MVHRGRINYLHNRSRDPGYQPINDDTGASTTDAETSDATLTFTGTANQPRWCGYIAIINCKAQPSYHRRRRLLER